MASPLPKLLHLVGGKPMLAHVLESARLLQPSKLVLVVGHAADQLRERFADDDIIFAEQSEQLGTGHAVMQALPYLDDSPVTLVLNGDVPLVQISTLDRLVAAANAECLAVLTVELPDPAGYGRILRDHQGQMIGIVEQKDATAEQLAICEVNTGIMAVPTRCLAEWLASLKNANAQAEYYLTDIFAMANSDGVQIATVLPEFVEETLGINSQVQRVEVERALQRRRALRLLEQGVILADINRIEQRGELQVGKSVSIDINCIFEGRVELADGVVIKAGCILKDVVIGVGAVIEPYCHIVGASIGAGARIGPYARLRTGTELADDVHIGNFVEVKNSQIGKSSKANHLSYLGDSTVGERVNIGAGTITCNYDGANKHRTEIEDDVHIGSDVQLVAPVVVAAGATVGAGTTVWKDIGPGELAINPKTQQSKTGWLRPRKQSKKI